MAFKNNTNSFKRKANSYKKYFNYHKLGHFGRDYSYPNKRFQWSNPNLYSSNNNNSSQLPYKNGANKPNSLKNNFWPCLGAHQIIENKKDNSDFKPFRPS